MPMMDTFTNFSMVAVYKMKGEIKFVHIKSEKFVGKFTILIFMDDKLSDLEIEEWKEFNEYIKDFKQTGAYVVGVCTDSHISMRAMMMNSFPDIAFPIISDRDGDFSRAFGVLKVKNGKLGAARALVILDTEGRMVHFALNNENTKSNPVKVMELIKHLKDVNTGVDESPGTSSQNASNAISNEESKPDTNNENNGSKDMKVNENNDPEGTESRDNKERDPKVMEEKKNTDVEEAGRSEGHKKPHDHNWLEAGAPLSQD